MKARLPRAAVLFGIRERLPTRSEITGVRWGLCPMSRVQISIDLLIAKKVPLILEPRWILRGGVDGNQDKTEHQHGCGFEHGSPPNVGTNAQI